MKARISKIKFYNSIKASSRGGVGTQLDYVDVSDSKFSQYQIMVDGSLIKISNVETGETTYTTTNNVVYFSIFES